MKAGMVGLAALYWPVATGKGLAGHPEVEFRAAATLGEDTQTIARVLGQTPEEYAARFGLRLYTSAEEMIQAEGLDTVVLIVRHSAHADWVERLAPLGVNVFIPKTFTTTQEDAARIVAAQERHAIRIAVGPTARYLPPMMAVKHAIDQGRIGPPFGLRICHHHGSLDVFDRLDWYRDAAEGGPELSLGWYGIDLILHLMDDRITRVYADYGNFTSPDSPFMDYGRMACHLAGGGSATFDMYFCNRFAYPGWQLEVVGPQGLISIHRAAAQGTATVVSLEGPQGSENLPVPEVTPGWETFWIDEFLQDRPPSVSVEQAATITQVALAARTSASIGQAVTL
jgi:predicted dehydrogenase